MNAFPCATASEESHHISKFESHYTKVDFGQNVGHVIIYVYCACAKTSNCLFDSLHAFLVIWAIRLIWVIRQSGFYTCPNVGIAVVCMLPMELDAANSVYQALFLLSIQESSNQANL